MTPLTIGEQILNEVRSLHQRLDALEEAFPAKGKTWLTPQEFSRLAGVTPRTLQVYVDNGRLRPESYKRQTRGKTFNYRYHRELALRDLEITNS